ncbi:hypothetical protein BGZ60DRAFT_122063 [Tricladium varicosporioides]|nr:hypothetical protein BGZ60DRAFT_122063 [Hymenoscyphus varicosporioides]
MSVPRPKDKSPILSFINLSGSQRATDRAINKKIRSHAMSRYQKEKRSKRKTGFIGLTKPNLPKLGFYHVSERIIENPFKKQEREKESSGYTKEPHVPIQVESPLSRIQEVSPVGTHTTFSQHDDDNTSEISFEMLFNFKFSPIDGMTDPFNVMALPSSPRVLMLLQVNLASPIRTAVHADPTERYRSYCTEDQGWLYMSLSYAASRVDPKNPKQQASDSTIATVSCLANIENLNGASASARVHVNGLRKMVELRGGLESLGMRGILRRMVLWTDLCNAARSNTAPLFPFIPFSNTPSLSSFYSNPFSSRLAHLQFTPALLLASYNNQHQAYTSILPILRDLHDLAIFLNNANGSRVDEELPPLAAYPDRVYTVEHRILTALSQEPQLGDLNHDTDSVIFSLLLHVSLLYVYTNLRQTPVGGQIRQSILSRFRSRLQISHLGLCSQLYSTEMLWITIVGIMGSNGQDQYLLDSARQLCPIIGLHTWRQINKYLELSMPTWETTCATRCGYIWECIWNKESRT